MTSRLNPLRRLGAITELPLRVQAVRDRLEQLGPDGFAASLDGLARDAARGLIEADANAMLACALWLTNDGRPQIGALLDAAQGGDHLVATAMLEDGPAHKQMSRHGRLPNSGGSSWVVREAHVWHQPEWVLRPHLDALLELVYGDAAHVPAAYRAHEPRGATALPGDVGEWKWAPFSARQIADQVSYLALRPEPTVLRTLLRGRSVRAPDVVKIASRRPTTAAIVDELVSHPRWMARPDVRNALVKNPFTPTRTALLFLPTCRDRLPTVAKANVHPRLQALARMLTVAR